MNLTSDQDINIESTILIFQMQNPSLTLCNKTWSYINIMWTIAHSQVQHLSYELIVFFATYLSFTTTTTYLSFTTTTYLKVLPVLFFFISITSRFKYDNFSL